MSDPIEPETVNTTEPVTEPVSAEAVDTVEAEAEPGAVEAGGAVDDPFTPGTVVLAKLKGFPPWPGIVLSEVYVPPQILKSKPKSDRSKRKDPVPVRFFNDDNYMWATDSDLKLLTSEDAKAYVENVTSKSKKDKSLIAAYRIAITPPSLSDYPVQPPVQEKEKKRKLSEPKEKKEKKRKVDKKKNEEKESKEERTKQVLFLRHRLQKSLLMKSDNEDMDVIDRLFQKLETFAGLDINIIKVLKNIQKLENVPMDEKYNFRQRAQAVLQSWSHFFDEKTDEKTDAEKTDLLDDREEAKEKNEESKPEVEEAGPEPEAEQDKTDKPEPEVGEEKEEKTEAVEEKEEKTEETTEEKTEEKEEKVEDKMEE